MLIAIGSDHAGFGLKKELVEFLKKRGEKVRDFGPENSDSVDYPVYAKKVANAVASGECQRGVLICGSGIGMSMAANKVKGIRAALCSEPLSAELSRQHNNANVLCMGARMIGTEMAQRILSVWIATEFSEQERHQRRIDLIEDEE